MLTIWYMRSTRNDPLKYCHTVCLGEESRISLAVGDGFCRSSRKYQYLCGHAWVDFVRFVLAKLQECLNILVIYFVGVRHYHHMSPRGFRSADPVFVILNNQAFIRR